MLLRLRGEIVESLKLFQRALERSPRSVDFLKQIARSLFLLGRFKGSLDVYLEAARLSPTDWEINHSIGMCYLNLNEYEEAAVHLQVRERLKIHLSLHLSMSPFIQSIPPYTHTMPCIYTRLHTLYIHIYIYKHAYRKQTSRPPTMPPTLSWANATSS